MIPGSHVDISAHRGSDKVPDPVESTRAIARVYMLEHLLTYIINLASAEQKKKAHGFGSVRREVHMRSSRVPGFEIRKDEEQDAETTLSFNGEMDQITIFKSLPFPRRYLELIIWRLAAVRKSRFYNLSAKW